MTQPHPTARNRRRLLASRLPIAAVLLLAGALRLHGIGFGLPALNDPDEPVFMMAALDMLRRQSLDPQWFGHPGTVTLYCLAAIIAAAGGLGVASGRFADVAGFAAAVHLDPGLVFLPARVFVALNGVLCVWLAWRIGLKLWGRREGLAAALLLSVNALHVEWSQVIRTDVQASVFMQLCVLRAVSVHRDGRMRDLVLAGVLAGLATATKWPAGLIVVCPMAAALAQGGGWRRAAVPLLAAATALLLASPYLVIDHARLLADLAHEARTTHPGATGSGPIGNLAWYAAGPLARTLGWAGLALAVAGTVGASLRDRACRIAVLPGYALVLAVLCCQHLVWERWLVPLLPALTLAIAWALCRLADALVPRARAVALPAILALIVVPMALSTRALIAERATDTRQLAAQWSRAHLPPGSRIVVEHAAFDMLAGPWRLLFPLGAAGCVDARAMLRGEIGPRKVDAARAGAPVLDFGNLDPATLPTCRADYALLSHRDRYPAGSPAYSAEHANYAALLRGARPLARFHPVRGKAGGPTVEVFALPPDPPVISGLANSPAIH